MEYNFSYEEQLKYEGLTEFIDAQLKEGYKVMKSGMLCDGVYQIHFKGGNNTYSVEYFVNLDYRNYDWDWEYTGAPSGLILKKWK